MDILTTKRSTVPVGFSICINIRGETTMKQMTKDILLSIYKIFCFTILGSLISVLAFVCLNYSITFFQETNNLTWQFTVGIISAALGFCYLSVANFLYWIAEYNLFRLEFLEEEE